jgi:hypothetical protein
MIGCKSALHSGLCVVLALAGAKLVTFARTQVPLDDFHEAVARAAKLSTLTEPGAPPFHLKLTAQDTSRAHIRDYNAEIEIWWAAPDKWRRTVKSPVFSQTAIQNGSRYYESNSADYLPFWLDELIQASTNPVPVDALANVSANEDRPGCENWEVAHGSGDQKFSSYASLCFNGDGTVQQIFASPIGIIFGAYEAFGSKRVPQRMEVWGAGDLSDVAATLAVAEALTAPSAGTSSQESNFFDVPQDTGFASRVRFASVPVSALTAADEPRPPLKWPSSYVFPLDGVVALTAHIDRAGNIRAFPLSVSKNQAINHAAMDQVKEWKFKPYVIDGWPVQVATTLGIPFHLKYAPLGANGKEFEPISFADHIRRYHVSTDLRVRDGEPFDLRASLTTVGGEAGKYEEVWHSPDEWMRRVTMGGIVLQERRAAGTTTTQFNGDDRREFEMKAVVTAMQDRLPDPENPHMFQEQDWGNSAVPASNVYPNQGSDSSEPVLIRPARGAVNAGNHPTSGQAYWFDSDGILRASFADGETVVYSNFEAWNKKRVARRIEVFIGPVPSAVITIDSIEAPGSGVTAPVAIE